MKQTDKVVLKHKKLNNDDLFDAVKRADEDDLRVLLAALLLEDDNGEAKGEDICRAIEIDEATLGASLKFWRGASVMSTKRAGTKPQPQKEDKPEKPKSAHKDGKLENDSLPVYATDELNELMKKRHITADFIAETSRIYGKIFNQHDVNIIVRMIDYLGFEEECVLMLLSHFAKEETKKSLRYIEKMAIALYDEGISTPKELEKKLNAIEAAKTAEGQIRSIFGMGSRPLSTKEKKYVSAWIEKMGFDIEMIRLAYDITVDKTHEPSLNYANAILERWHVDGIDTPEKVRAAEEKRNESKVTQTGRSFDVDDFFEAALRRTFSEDD